MLNKKVESTDCEKKDCKRLKSNEKTSETV